MAGVKIKTAPTNTSDVYISASVEFEELNATQGVVEVNVTVYQFITRGDYFVQELQLFQATGTTSTLV